ncbi:hypothetical protein BDV34DRAFT_228052 [Aspergillus parasiticus]|uniref:Uncharacterized protein n=1 Tax=Aspergillus parasiticus TaxID=5067 RepID=A0A5N6DC54_ASPPA|nr:hypothetical protein BDV34DRAFT_228052 [Aspergillus parasiticus]
MSDNNAIHCDFSAIMSIGTAPTVTQAVSLLQFTMFSDGPEYGFLEELVVPEKTAYSITYYNKFGMPYMPQQVVIIDGQLSAQKVPAGYSTLQVRADIMTPFPGNIKSDSYLNSVPPVYNPRLSVVGNIMDHHTDSGGHHIDTLASSSAPTSSAPTATAPPAAPSAELSSAALGKQLTENPPSDDKHKKKKKRSSAIFAPKNDHPSSLDWPSQLLNNNNV